MDRLQETCLLDCLDVLAVRKTDTLVRLWALFKALFKVCALVYWELDVSEPATFQTAAVFNNGWIRESYVI